MAEWFKAAVLKTDCGNPQEGGSPQDQATIGCDFSERSANARAWVAQNGAHPAREVAQ